MAGKVIVRKVSKESPIAVLIGWGNALLRHLIKYCNIFESQEFTTVCLTTVNFYMKPESLANSYRKKILQTLEQLTKGNPDREIILMAFSQAGANVLASMVQHMDILKFNIVGTIFDSGPMMYNALAVAPTQGAVWSPYRETSRGVTERIVDGGGFIRRPTEHEVNKDPFLKAFDSTIMGYSSLAPQLFLCSSVDKVVNYNDILDFSRRREERGVPIYVKVWNDCDHVGLFCKHPDEYETVLKEFIEVCLFPKQRWIVELL